MKEYKELKKVIKKQYKHFYKLAKIMDIDRVTLSYKLNGFRPFTVEEIRLLHTLLNLTDEQVTSFFHL